jgi:hypothetical protein
MTSDNILHGNSKKKANQETSLIDRTESAASAHNENRPADQDLELATLNAFRQIVRRCGDHNHLHPAGCHRCFFIPKKWEKAEPFPENHRGIERRPALPSVFESGLQETDRI